MLRQFWILLMEFSILSMLFLLHISKKATIRIHKDIQIKEDTWKDWHNYKVMYVERKRIGLGEFGKSAELNQSTNRELEEKMIKKYSLNALLSDEISVNRSVPDIRDRACLYEKYLSNLPPVSVIIPFHHEYLSTLTRTLHSIINRTPPELLKEIILIDDFSDIGFFGTLNAYVRQHIEKVNKIKIIRLPEHSGLIRARLAGIRAMTAKVFVILDAHIEVNYNWLPPLLEPIVKNKSNVVCPIIDTIHGRTFKYLSNELTRGGFNWYLGFKEIKYVPKDSKDNSKPFATPVMLGGLFAMSIEFFWELGGYDEGLDAWGGEQFELSFKIWMCGGQLLNAPCSRIAHHSRGYIAKDIFTTLKNYKRIGEVWMDEYKYFVYNRFEGFRDGFEYKSIDIGDVSARKLLRQNLNCKSFDWFMKEIAYDFLEKYPPAIPVDYAYGAIQSIATPYLCVDIMNLKKPGLYPCGSNLKNPRLHQRFGLTMQSELKSRHTDKCVDVPQYQKNAPIIFSDCHGKGGNQFWYYDRKTKWLNGRKRNLCLEAVPGNSSLRMNDCQQDNPNMKWNFNVINETGLDGIFIFSNNSLN